MVCDRVSVQMYVCDRVSVQKTPTEHILFKLIKNCGGNWGLKD